MAHARQGRETESLNGWWHTWLDEAVDWERETPLPPGTPAVALSTRAPSAGWDGMKWGMESTRVPGTLAQARPGYHGVAWQWRPIVIPEEWRGRLVHLHFGGARQRTEVYLDDRPVGDDADGLTPFTIDLTPYARPGGQHELALRLTNPGGWPEGVEGGAIRWGDAALPGSRDVGGLWGGVALEALPHLYVAELFVLPDETLGEATARVVLRNAGAPTVAVVRLSVLDAEGRPAGWAPAEVKVTVAQGEDAALTLPLTIAEPKGWSPGSPYLYRVVAEVRSDHGMDRMKAPLGLRRVEERDGRLFLDGNRLAPNPGAISGLSEGGALPLTPAEAERVVVQALSAGRDGLVAKGWPAAPELLDACDRAGMPVVQTLVGVEDPARVPGGARGLYEALARDRLRRLIRRDRNHPSVVAWRFPVARDAAAYGEYARLAHDEDPTRPIIPASARTACAPYSDAPAGTG